MPARRGARFLLEVAFLAALAAGLAFAKLDPAEIVGLMLVGWLLVAGVEWASWRSRPHFASGLPPRYVVPHAELPPPLPLEQVAVGYPEASRDEAPTWIATPALRAEMLGEPTVGEVTSGAWPVAGPAIAAQSFEQRSLDPDPVLDLHPDELPEPDSWTVVELPPAAPEPAPVRAAAVEPPAGPVRLARYSFDPLDAPSRRRFGRTRPGSGPGIDVPARPTGPRRLPGREH
jgi:hypothetical protein